MKKNYEEDYALITGVTSFGEYTTPEEQANKIKKCSILTPINVTFSDRILENSSRQKHVLTRERIRKE